MRVRSEPRPLRRIEFIDLRLIHLLHHIRFRWSMTVAFKS